MAAALVQAVAFVVLAAAGFAGEWAALEWAWVRDLACSEEALGEREGSVAAVLGLAAGGLVKAVPGLVLELVLVAWSLAVVAPVEAQGWVVLE